MIRSDGCFFSEICQLHSQSGDEAAESCPELVSVAIAPEVPYYVTSKGIGRDRAVLMGDQRCQMHSNEPIPGEGRHGTMNQEDMANSCALHRITFLFAGSPSPILAAIFAASRSPPLLQLPDAAAGDAQLLRRASISPDSMPRAMTLYGCYN